MAKKPAPRPSYLTNRAILEPSSTLGLQEKEEIVEQTVEQFVPPSPAAPIQDIPIERLKPNPFQPRQEFNQDDLDELKVSIQQNGFISILFVRPDPSEENSFQLAYGERRWRAAQLAGLQVIPCKIEEFTDDQMEDIALIENIQRKDLNPLDEAKAFAKKLEKINPKTGEKFSIRSLAEHLGVKRNRIEEPYRLRNLSLDLQQLVRQRPDASRMAFELEKLPTAELRQPVIAEVLNKEINTKDVIEIVERMLKDLMHAQEHNRQEEETSALTRKDAEKKRAAYQEQNTDSSVSVGGISTGASEGSKNQEEAQQGTPSPAVFQDVSAQLALFHRKRRSQMNKDIEILQTIIQRWSEWIGEPGSSREEFHTHISGWIAQLGILEERIKS